MNAIKQVLLKKSLANAEKIGFDTKLFAKHPFIKGKKYQYFFRKFCFNGLWEWGNI